MGLGASSRRAIAVTNIAMALWAMPLLFILPRDDFAWASWWYAVGAGVALFIGRIFSVKALEIGDLSVVGPLLGIKTLLVALFTFVTGQAVMTAGMWIAAVCASLAVMLVQRGPNQETADRRKAALYALLASIVFALTDILVVEARRGLSVGLLSPTLFIMVALLTPLLGRVSREPPEAHRPLYTGAAVMGFQTTLIVLMIGLTGQAVLINILYCSRVLWTVLADWLARRQERSIRFIGYRVAGAMLLMIALSTVILEHGLITPTPSTMLAESPPTAAMNASVAPSVFPADTVTPGEQSSEKAPEEVVDIHWPY